MQNIDFSIYDLADKLSLKFNRAKDLDALYQLVVNEVYESLNCETSVLYIFSRRRYGVLKLTEILDKGRSKRVKIDSEYKLGVKFLKKAISQGNQFFKFTGSTKDIPVEIINIFNHNRDYISSNKISNALASFLMIDSRPCGFVIAYNKKSFTPSGNTKDVSSNNVQFTVEDEKFFTIIVRQIQYVYRSKRRYQDLKKIHEVGIVLSSSKKLNEVLKIVTDETLNVLGADIVTLHQFNQETKDFIGEPFTAGEFFKPEVVKRILEKKDVSYQIIQDKKNYYVVDAMNDPLISESSVPKVKNGETHFVIREKVKSAAAVLLQVDEEVVGVMLINYRRTKKFPIEEKNLIEIFASYAAMAIKNAIEKDVLAKRLTTNLSNLNKIQESTDTHTTQVLGISIYRNALDAMLVLLDAELGLYAELNSEKNRFKAIATSKSYDKILGSTWDSNRGIMPYAIKTGEIQIVYDVEKDNRFLPIHKVADITIQKRSSISIPFFLDSEPHGVFHIDSNTLAAFSEHDKEMLKAVTNEAAKAMQAIKFKKNKELFNQKLAKLRKLDELIGTTWNLKTVLKFIAKMAVDLTKKEEAYGFVAMVEKINEVNYLVPVGSSDDEEIIKDAVLLEGEKSLNRLVIKKNKTINVTSYDDLWKENYLEFRPGMHSDLAVPIRVRGKPIGIISVESPDDKVFDKEDEEFVETLAGQAVLVIQMTRTIDSIKEIGLAGFSASRNDFLKKILIETQEMLGADFGTIWLFNNETKKFELSSYSGFEKNIWKDKNREISLDDSFSGAALKNDKISIASLDSPLDKSMIASQKTFNNLRKEGFKFIISTPFIIEGNPIGVMNIYTREVIKVDDWEKSLEKSLLELFATQISIALQNFQRYTDLQTANTRIKQSVNKTIFENMRSMLRLIYHRMNNSVGNVRADIIDLLDISDKFDEKIIRKFKNMKIAAEEALNIPKEINKFTQKLKSIKTKVDIDTIIQNVIETKTAKGICFQYNKPQYVPAIEANPEMMKEVFSELIQNAIKAMPKGGQITISVQKRSGNMLEVKVMDQGHGIAEKNLNKIFEYGYTDWERAEGSGDGLPLIQTVIEVDHKGTITVENNKNNQGCTFTVTLPIFGTNSN